MGASRMYYRCHSFLYLRVWLGLNGVVTVSLVPTVGRESTFHSLLSTWSWQNARQRLLINSPKLYMLSLIGATLHLWNGLASYTGPAFATCHVTWFTCPSVIQLQPLCQGNTFSSCHTLHCSGIQWSLLPDIYVGSSVVAHFSVDQKVFCCVNVCYRIGASV